MRNTSKSKPRWVTSISPHHDVEARQSNYNYFNCDQLPSSLPNSSHLRWASWFSGREVGFCPYRLTLSVPVSGDFPRSWYITADQQVLPGSRMYASSVILCRGVRNKMRSRSVFMPRTLHRDYGTLMTSGALRNSFYLQYKTSICYKYRRQ